MMTQGDDNSIEYEDTIDLISLQYNARIRRPERNANKLRSNCNFCASAPKYNAIVHQTNTISGHLNRQLKDVHVYLHEDFNDAS